MIFFTTTADQCWFTLWFTRSLTRPSSCTKGDEKPGNNHARKDIDVDYRLFTILWFSNKRKYVLYIVYITTKKLFYIRKCRNLFIPEYLLIFFFLFSQFIASKSEKVHFFYFACHEFKYTYFFIGLFIILFLKFKCKNCFASK